MLDLTQIEREGEFAKSIREYFEHFDPKIIIETGLYHGNGSTSIISSLIKYIPIKDAQFFSIECNAQNIEIAKENLRKKGLLPYVSIINGLSIPKDLLPSVEKINEKIAEAAKFKGVKLDHEQDPSNGAFYYQKETSQSDKEDCLGNLLQFVGDPDFVLLDSGGHIGEIEFRYLISKLRKPCGIALDDTRHIKHYKSRDFISKDERFEVLVDNQEKFGSMVCKFTP